jgi:hypothetical protein
MSTTLRGEVTLASANNLSEVMKSLSRPKYATDTKEYMITEAGEEAMTRARSWHTAKLTPAMRGPDSKHEFEVKWSTGRGTLSGTILRLKSTAKVDGQSKVITSHVHFNGGYRGRRLITEEEYARLLTEE